MRRLAVLAILGTLAAAALPACAATGRTRTASTVEALSEIRAAGDAGKRSITSTVAAMSAIEASDGRGLDQRYDAFVRDLDSLEDVAARLRARDAELRERMAAYFRSWDEQVAAMANPEVQKSSQDRKAEIEKAFAEMTAAMEACREKYGKFSAHLTDVRGALDLDLSPNGVKALSGPMRTARSDAETVHEAIDEVIEELDDLAKEMNAIQEPASAPAPAAATASGSKS